MPATSVAPIDDGSYQNVLAAQQENPVVVMQDDSTGRRWWLFRGDAYWEDDRLSAQDVRVLVLDRLMQSRKKLQRAEARLSTNGDDPRRIRETVPDEIKVLVWQRDQGRCVRCQSGEDLEFDHIIPLAKGGSNSFRNLQILCGNCNREKGGHLA